MRRSIPVALAMGLLALAACSPKQESPAVGAKNANVDDARLLAAAKDGANWLSYGRTYDEQRFSPLTQIDDKTVAGLGLEWSADLDTARGQEATPLMHDGVGFEVEMLYLTIQF